MQISVWTFPSFFFKVRTFIIIPFKCLIYFFLLSERPFGFRSRSKKSRIKGFGSNTYFHITNQNITTTPPTHVTDEIEYNISLEDVMLINLKSFTLQKWDRCCWCIHPDSLSFHHSIVLPTVFFLPSIITIARFWQFFVDSPNFGVANGDVYILFVTKSDYSSEA